jgi:hypothetical protein
MKKLGWIVGGIMLMGKTKVLGQKPVPVPLCPLVWDGVQAPNPPVARDRQLPTPWHSQDMVYVTSVCVQFSVRFSHLMRCFKIVTECPREVSYLVTEEGFL